MSITTQTRDFIAEHDVIFLIVCGAHAYGTATRESDIDIRGVYIPKRGLAGMIDGFKPAKVIEGEPDIVLQPVHRFLKLCAQGNPNLLDWMFAPLDCLQMADPLFCKRIIGRRQIFLTKRLHERFRGYAISHLQKMERGTTRELGAKRKADIEAHGYSCKNAMHLVRLARMGCEVLETGKYNVRRPDADELLAIRRGKWTLEQVREEGSRLLQRLDEAVVDSPLPEDIDMDEICHMVISYLSENWKVKQGIDV
jgi:predicted nucleotidyltransferase